MPSHYLNFILYFDYVDGAEKDQNGRIQEYSVRVFDSPVGEGEIEEKVLIHDWDDIEAWRLAGRSGFEKDFKKFAVRLGELMLPPYAKQLFIRSMDRLKDDEGLRIRLRLIPELTILPWEYFIAKQHVGEVSPNTDCPALHHRISIVRHEAISIPAHPFRTNPYRRVVFAMASPEPYEDYPRLDLAGEQTAIKEKFGYDRVSGVKAEYYPDFEKERNPIGITKEDLSLILREPADVFHFSGHGIFHDGNGSGQGLVVLADEHNQAIEVESHLIGNILAQGNIRLVVLGACKTGTRDRFTRWSSVAVALLKVGIPAVVAMQFSVYDDSEKLFASKLYENLVAGNDIDEAVTQGRMAIQRAEEKGRDWGAPVLYMRNSGGKIFPPVADEQARLLAERVSKQDTTRDKIFLGWVQRGTLATPEQLDEFRKGGDTLNLSCLDAILLLQSALAADQAPAFWVRQLQKIGKKWLLAVDNPEYFDNEKSVEPAAQQLGLTGQLKAPPENVGMLAWSAAVHPDKLISTTAGLAQLAADPENAFTKLQTALSLSYLDNRRQRRARLIGMLAEASSKISQDLPKRLDNFQDRFSVWWYRVWWRIKRTRIQLMKWSLGGAFGAGLALALWRAFWAIFNVRFVGSEFAIQSYWGFIIGLFMSFGMVLASPLLLLDPEGLGAEQVKRRNRLAVLLGAVGFCLANSLVLWMTGLGVTLNTFLAFLFTSFLAGLILGIGLIGQPWAEWPTGTRTWLKRLLLPALFLALLQTPALCEGATRPDGEYFLDNALWQVSSVFDTSNAVFGKYYDFFESAFDQCVPGEIGRCCLACPGTGPLLGCLEEWLSILDAAATGIVLIVGMLTGLHFPRTGLGETCRRLLSRLGLSD